MWSEIIDPALVVVSAVAIVLFSSIPVLSQPQTAPTPVVKPTMADVNKVVKGIIADEAKLHTYCDLADINGQMVEADQKNDEKVLQELSVKADRLEESLGPEYVELMIGLEKIDENSAEGKAMGAAFESIDEKCR